MPTEPKSDLPSSSSRKVRQPSSLPAEPGRQEESQEWRNQPLHEAPPPKGPSIAPKSDLPSSSSRKVRKPSSLPAKPVGQEESQEWCNQPLHEAPPPKGPSIEPKSDPPSSSSREVHKPSSPPAEPGGQEESQEWCNQPLREAPPPKGPSIEPKSDLPSHSSRKVREPSSLPTKPGRQEEAQEGCNQPLHEAPPPKRADGTSMPIAPNPSPSRLDGSLGERARGSPSPPEGSDSPRIPEPCDMEILSNGEPTTSEADIENLLRECRIAAASNDTEPRAPPHHPTPTSKAPRDPRPLVSFLDGFHGHGAVLELLRFPSIESSLGVRLIPRGGFDKSQDARTTWTQRSGLRSYGGDAKDVFAADELPDADVIFSGAMCVDTSAARVFAALEHGREPPPPRDPLGGANEYYFLQSKAYVRKDAPICVYEYLPGVLYNGGGVGQERLLAPHLQRGDLVVQWVLDECTLGVETPKGGHETRLITVCVRPDIAALCGPHIDHPLSHCQPDILLASLDWRLPDSQVPNELWVEFSHFDHSARPSLEARHAPTCVGAGTNAAGDRTFVYLLKDLLRCPTIRGERAYGGTGVYRTESGRFRRLSHLETVHAVHSYPRLSSFDSREAIVNAWSARMAYAIKKSVTDYARPAFATRDPSLELRAAAVAYTKAKVSWPARRAFSRWATARLGKIRFQRLPTTRSRPAVVVVPITTEPRPRILAGRNGSLLTFQEPPTNKRKDSVDIAEKALSCALGREVICALAGEFKAGEGPSPDARLRVIAYAVKHPPNAPPGSNWHRIDDDMLPNAERICAASAARWTATMCPTGPRPLQGAFPAVPSSAPDNVTPEHLVFDKSLAPMGTRTPALITAPTRIPLARPEALDPLVQKSNLAANELQARLRAEKDAPGDEGFMASWANSISADVSLDDLPSGLRGATGFDVAEACRLPFPEDYIAASTTPPRDPPLNQSDARPHDIQDLLGTTVLERLETWLKQFATDLRRMIRGEPRQFRTPFVIAQEELPRQYRGVVWDLREHLRSHGQKPITPLDARCPLKSHLNLDLLDELLRDYPDQELRSHLTQGICSRTQLPLQTALFPHLTSLPAGAEKVEREILKFEKKHGWYEFFGFLPFVPFRTMPQGTAQRKGQPGRPRRTSDGGAPRKPLMDSSGLEVPSYNESIGIRDKTSAAGAPETHKWAKEIKPTVADKARACHVLCGASALLDEPVFAMTDDVASFFNQLQLCSEDLWKQGHLWTSLREGLHGPFQESEVTFVAEYCLGFGLAHSSNIAQRFAHALVHVIQDRFDREEEARGVDPRWAERRAHLDDPRQRRLYHISMYTDDKMSVVVGADRFVRLLRQWRGLTLPLRMLMAGPDKQGGGPVVDWLGLRFYVALNALVIPKEKLARALAMLDAVLDDRAVTHSEYRQLCGLLVHLHPWAAMDDDALYGLWRCLDSHAGPADPIIRSLVRKDVLQEWVARLSGRGGIPFQAAFGQRPTDAPENARADFAISCDAAKLGAEVPGIAGYMAGLFWVIELQLRDLQGPLEIPIVLLEFVGIVVSLIVFGRIVGRASVVLYTDSDTSASILRNRAHSPLTQAAHRALLQSPEYEQLRSNGLAIGHLRGEGNIFADLASRGHLPRLNTLCAQMGVSPMQVPVPQRALDFLDLIRSERFEIARAQGFVTGPAPPDRFNCVRSPDFVSKHATAVANASKQSSNEAADGPWEGAIRRPMAPPRRPLTQSPPDRPTKKTKFTTRARPMTNPLATIPPRRPLPAMPERGLREVRRWFYMREAPRPAPTPRASIAPEETTCRTRVRTGPSQNRRGPFAPGLIPKEAPYSLLPPLSEGHDLAIGQANTEWFADLRDAGHYHITTRSANTKRRDSQTWRRWTAFCRRAGASPHRADTDANSGLDHKRHEEEVELALAFILDEYANMAPRSFKERPRALPKSAVDLWYGVKREHVRLYKTEMVRSRAFSDLLRSLERHYADIYGAEYLLPHRKEPFTEPILRKLLSIPEGTRLARGFVIKRGSPLTTTFLALWAVLAETGFRKDEIAVKTEDTPFPRTKLSRWHLRWRIQGQIQQTLSLDQLGLLTEGDYAVILPATAKNDQSGQKFGNSPIYLHIDPDDPLCAATRLAKMEAFHPVDPNKRRTTALFSRPDGKPLFFHLVETSLKTALASFLTHEERRVLSNHSFRIGLASALMNAGEPYPVIKAICRWKDDRSVDLYARITPEQYRKRLASAKSGYRQSPGRLAVNLPRG